MTKTTTKTAAAIQAATRYTAFAGEYVAGHGDTAEQAIQRGREHGWTVSRVVLRARAYPFRTIETWEVGETS